MESLYLKETSVRFGTVHALKSVDLRVSAGEIVMLVGPNGAGKSTLIRVLLGLVRADAGELLVDGKSQAVDSAFKTQLGYLPEAVAFAENLSGRQVLSFFASARGVPKRRVTQVLERVGLTQAAKRAVRGYSRGMRQRLGLGLSILSDPDLLILDEPTGGLDQEGLAVLWSILKEWQKAKRLVLLASHELTLLERRVNRLCVLKQGKLIANDSPSQIRQNVSLPVSIRLSLDEHPTTKERIVDKLQAAGLNVSQTQTEHELQILAPPEQLKSALQLASAESGVGALRVVEPGLDDIYEHLLSGDE